MDSLKRAQRATLADLIAPGLRVLFCGINPSLYSEAAGQHFARPGNRFWKALHGAGFTERVLHPSEQRELLLRGIGITNVVPRASTAASELSLAEYQQGTRSLRRKLTRYRPRVVAFLGLGAYRIVAAAPQAEVGPQPLAFAGVEAWALPNPSGLNAHYQLPDLIECYARLAQRLAG